ncbi:MAG: gliding motility-associated C-terminal domain-containing protein [Saprospiraceae bacterium]
MTTASLPQADCVDADSIYQTQTVDFIVEDQCGNRDTTTARFDVIDTDPPQFIDCPGDTTIFVVDETMCGAFWRIFPIPVVDECGVRNMPLNSGFKSRDVRSPDPGNPEVTVDTVEFSFFALPPPFFPNGGAELTIRLSNVDAEQPTEYYNIYGENQEFLGITENTPIQCDTSTTVITNITPEQLGSWAADGRIVIFLEPNVPEGLSGEFAINDICPGGTIDIKLEYELSEPNSINYEYSVNDSAPTAIPIPSQDFLLPVGDNVIKYFAEDCSGNRDSCVYTVTVVDTIPPRLVCNGSQTIAIDESACTAAFTVPLPLDIFDNCEAGERYDMTMPAGSGSSAFITFSSTPNIPGFVADERTYNFPGTAANAVGAVELIATIRANISGPNRHFTLVGEDGTELGRTSTNGRCDTTIVSTVTVPADLFNEYAADGQVSITARPQRIFQSGRNYVTPCFVPNVMQDGDVDSVSTFNLRLTYQGVNPEFTIEGATSVPLMQMMPPQVTPTFNLNVGENIITYFVDDIYENRGSCSDTITVIDTIPPVALCQGTTVFINPSGTVNDTIQVSEIDAGSSDNCGIANISVSPNVFGCDLIDQDTVIVTLRVEDLSGNVSTCQAPIRIVAQKPEPTFLIGNCASSDTLFLFANPPAAPGGIVYTYEWTGPNGYQSDIENPVIGNVTDAAAGTYTVTITGITGCIATGIIEVDTDDIPISPAIVAPDVICSNEDLVLETTDIPGASYEWYSGTPDDSQLLATTSTPMFTVETPAIGTLSYFVITLQEGCTVEPSEVKQIEVVEQPEAVVNESNITICEGESITLQTFVEGEGITYRWTGPDGYESSLQFPPVIENATSINAGTYRLVISRGGCDSEPAFTAVNILERPSQPQISNNGPVCEGEELTLTTNVANASIYTWIAPDFTERTTNVPTLNITTTAMDNGNWSLFVTRNTCDSEQAVPTSVMVNALPALVVSSDPNPACAGQDIQLNASPTLDGATYQWTGPNGFTSAAQNPTLRDARLQDNGTYTVTITTAEGCMQMQTLELEIQPGVEISGITNNGSNCLDGPTDIELSAMLFPADDGTYMYEWRGPNGNLVSSDSIAIIPNATQSNNGTYTLTVSSSTGCNSATATTIVNVTDPPAPPNSPQFNVSTMPPFCEGDLVTLETNGYSGQVEYIWTTPLGTIMTETPSLTIESVIPDNTGAYSVAVRQNGCISNRSGQTNVVVTPTPIAIVDSNSPVCAGNSISLEMNVVEGANVTYAWTGPGGFTSSVRNPVIEVAAEENQGTYIGTVTVNGCISMGSSVEVEISPVPTAPVATSNGPICIGDEDATLILAVVPSSATPGAMYTWYDSDGNQLNAASQSLTFIITDFAGYGDGMFPFTVEAEIDGCISESAQAVMVQMNTIPDNAAFAGDDTNVCENEAVTLNATAPTIGSGLWTQIDGQSVGISIANPNQANTTVSGLLGGNSYTFQWSLSNGACADYSMDEVTLTVDVVEKADAGMDIDTCEVSAVFLAANASTTGEGEWSQPDVQAQLGVNIVDPSAPNTEVMGLVPGNQYVFTWTIFDNQCAETTDDVLVLVASGTSFAGADFSACGTGCAELNATASPNNDGRWSSPDNDLDFTDPSNPNTIVCGLKPGDNRLVWTINEGACGENSIDEVIVSYTEGPVAVADEVIVEVGGVIEFDVDFNDNVIGDFTVAILDAPRNGTIEEIEQGLYTYTADPSFIGTDELTYEICNIGCECSTATVTFFVGGDPTCTPPSIFTPNNDGINDAFVIPCLNDDVNFPEANVSIFNQWGDEVFRAGPYKNTWQGRFDGEELPEGTYFYVIEFVDGSEPQSGFVMLQR